MVQHRSTRSSRKKNKKKQKKNKSHVKGPTSRAVLMRTPRFAQVHILEDDLGLNERAATFQVAHFKTRNNWRRDRYKHS
jgi:hypothetical protein